MDGCGDMYVGTNVDVYSAEWWVPASSPAPSLAILSWWKSPSSACSCVEDRDFVNKESGYFVVVKLCQNHARHYDAVVVVIGVEFEVVNGMIVTQLNQ